MLNVFIRVVAILFLFMFSWITLTVAIAIGVEIGFKSFWKKWWGKNERGTAERKDERNRNDA